MLSSQRLMSSEDRNEDVHYKFFLQMHDFFKNESNTEEEEEEEDQSTEMMDVDQWCETLENQLVITKKEMLMPKKSDLDIKVVFLIIQLENKERRELTKILVRHDDNKAFTQKEMDFINSTLGKFKSYLDPFYPLYNLNEKEIFNLIFGLCKTVTENIGYMFIHGPDLKVVFLSDEEFELIKNIAIVQGGGFRDDGDLHNCIMCGNDRQNSDNDNCINCKK